MRYFLLVLSILFFSACSTTAPKTSEAPETPAPAAPQETANAIPEPQGLPGMLEFVGDPTAGQKVSNALDAEGMAVTGNYSGSEEGFKTFCSGKADGLVLTSAFTSEERNQCRKMGGDWSALGTADGTVFLYIRYIYADAFLERSDMF